MKPWEFWDITPADLRILQEADRERVSFQRLLAAERASWMQLAVNRGAWGGGVLTPWDFVPEQMPSPVRRKREEARAKVQRMKARHLFGTLGIKPVGETEH